MSNSMKNGLFYLLMISLSVFGTENFSGMGLGKEPSGPQWGATKGKIWKVVDSGDDHGKVLQISGGANRFGRCNFSGPIPRDSAALLIEFDFKLTGNGNQEIGVLDRSFRLSDYFNSAAFRLKFDGTNASLLYFDREQWNSAGHFDKKVWNHLRLELLLSGSDAGKMSLTLNGRDMGKFPFRLNGKKTRFERLWFADQKGGKDQLFIDNLDLKFREGKMTSKKIVLESPERVKPFSFFSKSLGKKRHCLVVLPSETDQDGGKKHPLLIVLHGRGRNASSLLREPESRRALMNFRGIVLLVQGDDGWYIDSPVKSEDRYGSMMSELIETAKRELPVSPSRDAWGILGWSMGAYAAAMTAEAHPDRFSAAAFLIGVLDYPRTGLPAKQSYPIDKKRFGTDPERWARFNPIMNIGKLAGMKLFIRTGVYSFDLIMNRNFRDRVIKLNIPCDYKELPGGHEFSLVCGTMYEAVDFMNRSLRHP